MSDNQATLFDAGEPQRPSGPDLQIRYQDRVTVEKRCATCGTLWSFHWAPHPRQPERSVCGDCLGLTYEQVWGEKPFDNWRRTLPEGHPERLEMEKP